MSDDDHLESRLTALLAEIEAARPASFALEDGYTPLTGHYAYSEHETARRRAATPNDGVVTAELPIVCPRYNSARV